MALGVATGKFAYIVFVPWCKNSIFSVGNTLFVGSSSRYVFLW